MAFHSHLRTQLILAQHYPPKDNKGILKTSVGYTGGLDTAKNPSYQDVCSGRTGHAEAVRIEFDPSVVKYEELVGAKPSIAMLVTDRSSASLLRRILLPHTRPHNREPPG
jgi:hypothetical protein